MGIRDPVAGTLSAYSLSVRATLAVTQAVVTGAPLDIPAYEQAAKATMEAGRADRERADDGEIDRLMTEMTAGRKRTITRTSPRRQLLPVADSNAGGGARHLTHSAP